MSIMSLLQKLFFPELKPTTKKSKKAGSSSSKSQQVAVNRYIKELQKENERIDREFNREISELAAAEATYKETKDIDRIISVYEDHFLDLDKPQWNAFGYCLSLADYYIKAKRYDDAWSYLNKMIVHMAQHPENNWDAHNIRFSQFKVLKNEKKYKDAFCMLVMSYVIRSDDLQQPYFNKNSFLRDVKTTAKGLGLTEENLSDFVNQLEANIMAKSLHERGVSAFCSRFFTSQGI